ncbi:MAG TPA: glycerol-3-phosphate dehydrogenase/oxidase [Kiritimatiellia bacterium]|nr:glycerol-3-phosphate dehydrogenase/oxidase [Kiritimatiellia bacterium]HMO99187.1 glycerol-3-phosphate dehydrogenase/oxidase [Kiritimatiellia bacterium]HMP95774.1 glycerol-3-phosphate dehydrogenase/oxidase [Kiritimatiellia bacterium]
MATLRDDMIMRLADRSPPWDVVVIGGGATGLACALDAASRKLRVALVERGDFGEGTSSRSTKLIHGGVRYLRQGQISLVRESLRERAWFFRAAPSLVRPLPFVIPCRHFAEQIGCRTGMHVYDALAHTAPEHRARRLSRNETANALPGVKPSAYACGVKYFDGQFDDARMIIAFVRTLVELGGAAVNYAPVISLRKEGGRISGLDVEDREKGSVYRIDARCVINATGVHTVGICRMDEPATESRIIASQGIHLVLDHRFIGGESALLIPRTRDGRVLFAIPWHGRTLLGTTDTPWPDPERPPQPLQEEIDYVLEAAGSWLSRAPVREDIRGMFAGLRPLPRPSRTQKTSAIIRDFRVAVSDSGLVSVYGGKWTTCRAMGEAAVDRALAVIGQPFRPSQTAHLMISANNEPESYLHVPSPAWIAYAVREEMACNAEDLLLRRTRLGILDRAAAETASAECTRMIEATKQGSTLND